LRIPWEVRSAQASRASSQQEESGQKEEEASTTGRSSEDTEGDKKEHKLSAYHHWDQQSCVRFDLWYHNCQALQ